MTGLIDDHDRRDVPRPRSETAWNEAAIAAQVGQLEAVRGTADKWAGTVTALLGAFGTVAVATGTDAIDKLPEAWRVPFVVLTAIAGILAVLSIVFSARAVQGVTFITKNFTTSAYRAHVVGSAADALGNLRISRWTGIAAAALVFGASVAALGTAAGADEADQTNVLVVTTDGSIVCGTIHTDVKSGVVTVGTTDVRRATDVQTVESC